MRENVLGIGASQPCQSGHGRARRSGASLPPSPSGRRRAPCGGGPRRARRGTRPTAARAAAPRRRCRARTSPGWLPHTEMAAMSRSPAAATAATSERHHAVGSSMSTSGPRSMWRAVPSATKRARVGVAHLDVGGARSERHPEHQCPHGAAAYEHRHDPLHSRSATTTSSSCGPERFARAGCADPQPSCPPTGTRRSSSGRRSRRPSRTPRRARGRPSGSASGSGEHRSCSHVVAAACERATVMSDAGSANGDHVGRRSARGSRGAARRSRPQLDSRSAPPLRLAPLLDDAIEPDRRPQQRGGGRRRRGGERRARVGTDRGSCRSPAPGPR